MSLIEERPRSGAPAACLAGAVGLIDLPPAVAGDVRTALAGTAWTPVEGPAAGDRTPAVLLAAVDPPAFPPGRIAELERAHPGTPVIGLCAKGIEAFIDDLDRRRPVGLVAAFPRIDPVYLGAAIGKAAGDGPWSLGPYFPAGAAGRSFPLDGLDRKGWVLAEAGAFLAAAGAPSRTVEDALLVADELVANALADAPTGGEPRGGGPGPSGPAPAAIDPGPSSLALAWDGEQAGIAVTDPFGSLEPSAVLEALSRCFRKGPDQIRRASGGAGIGLYIAYSASSLLAFTVDPGRRTEATALVRRSPRESPVRSLGIFLASR